MRPGATCATGRVRLRSESVLLGYRSGGGEALGEGEGWEEVSPVVVGRDADWDARRRETLERRWADAGRTLGGEESASHWRRVCLERCGGQTASLWSGVPSIKPSFLFNKV